MTISLNKILQRKAVLAALEQAAREQAKAFDTLMRYAKCDKSSTGALVPRISYIAGLSGDVVRRHLRGARDAGQVIERAPSYKGGMSRWWPVGLFDKLQAERAAQEGAPC